MPLNEADTRAKLITPKLYQSGWNEGRLRREIPITDGRIYLVGDMHRRGKRKVVDYLLYHTVDLPIAIVEAKDETHQPGDGMQQAKDYAEMLGLKFAYSTNGHGIEEFDFITNQQRTLAIFPSPNDLWLRFQAHRRKHLAPSIIQETWPVYMASVDAIQTDPLLYSYNREDGKTPRYYQEVAIRNIIQLIQQGHRRVLLTMATGTGKTYVAFQVAWKLAKTGLVKRLLFVADRNVLRDQAYRTFAAFEDARCIMSGTADLNHQIYFGTYQALYGSEAGRRLFLDFAPDFFDLVIIDECHRSGFGTWHDILKHFSGAVHLGMTATPKREDNIDTYEYFCRENNGLPAYEYRMGQAIADGFLATYRVHRIATNIDKDGLHIEEAKTHGAEFYVPTGADLRAEYYMPQFEREIVLPDRTQVICEHLSRLLRDYGPMQRTIIFCVTMEHAQLVAKELQNILGAELGIPDYAQRIVSAERNADEYLERFRSSESPTPVVATTADLLETGVDIPSVKNLVFLKPVSSRVVFKQIVGRGSRLDTLTDKYWFRVIDYTNATRLFEEWDRPDDIQPLAKPEGPRQSFLRGTVVAEETEEPIPGVLVTVQIAPNEQAQCRTDEIGGFAFDEMPEGKVTLLLQPGKSFSPRQLTVGTAESADQEITIALKPLVESKVPPVKGEGVRVFVAEETYLELDATGKQLTVQEYINHAARTVKQLSPGFDVLLAQWCERKKRKEFLQQLTSNSVDPEVLAMLLKHPEADTFDTLAHVAFQAPLRSREERVRALENRHQGFLKAYGPHCRDVLVGMLDMYRLGGVEMLEHQRLFDTQPFAQMGYAPGVMQRCGGPRRLREAVDQLQRNLYL